MGKGLNKWLSKEQTDYQDSHLKMSINTYFLTWKSMSKLQKYITILVNKETKLLTIINRKKQESFTVSGMVKLFLSENTTQKLNKNRIK